MKNKIIIACLSAMFLSCNCIESAFAKINDISLRDPYYKVKSKLYSWHDYYDTYKKYYPETSDEEIMRRYVFHGGKDNVQLSDLDKKQTQQPATGVTATGVTPAETSTDTSTQAITATATENTAKTENSNGVTIKDYVYDPDTWITATDKPIEQLYYSEKFPDGSEKQVGYRYDAIKGEPNTAITRYTTIYFDNKTDNTKAPYYRIWETYDIKTGKWAEKTFDTLVESDKNKKVWGKDIQAFASLQNETIPKMGALSEAEQKLCIINLGLTDEQCKNLGLTVTVSDKEKTEAEKKVADGGELTKAQQLADLMNKFAGDGFTDQEIIQIIRLADGDLQALAETTSTLTNTTQNVAYEIFSEMGKTETGLLNAFKAIIIGSDSKVSIKSESSTSEATASSNTEKDNSSSLTSQADTSNSASEQEVFNKEEINTESDAPNNNINEAKQFQQLMTDTSKNQIQTAIPEASSEKINEKETQQTPAKSSTPSQYRAEAERRAAIKANPEKEPERYKRLVDDYEKSLIKVNQK